MKKFFVQIYVCGLAASVCLSCSGDKGAIVDNSRLVVQPGYGISNLFAIGMSAKDVENATHDASLHGAYDGTLSLKRFSQERQVCVQSLGATGVFKNDQRLGLLTFHLQPKQEPVIPGLTIVTPFKGSLGTNLHFTNGPVSKSDVEKVFGVISMTYTSSSQIPMILSEQPEFVWKSGNGFEEMHYPSRGLTFYLRSNTVEEFSVFSPTFGNNKLLKAPRQK